MKLKKTKKVVGSILLLCLIISNLCPAFAVSVGDATNVIFKERCKSYIKYTRNGATYVVGACYVGFYDDGEFRPAYCLDMSLPGVDDERTECGVTVEDMSSIRNNEQVWRVMVNGFPYKTPEQMGLETEEQAFLATKQAIYRILDGESTDNYSAINDMGVKIVRKIQELVDIGRNGTQTYQDPVINVSKIGDASEDNINNSYISQVYKIDSQVEMSSVDVILNPYSAPSGTYIGDLNNNAKTTFNQGESFKVLVPRENIDDNINVQISFNGKCKTYPILYGRAPSTGLQNYVMATDPFITSSTRATMEYVPSIDLEIEKKSNGDSNLTPHSEGQGIDGATFNVKSEDGSYNETFTTQNGGKIVITNLKIQPYIITEVSAADYFLMGKDTQAIVEPLYDGDDKKVTFENTPVDIKVNIEKGADKEEAQGNEIVTYEIDEIKNLSNVKLDNFTLSDELPKEVRIKSLETGTYNEELTYSVKYNTNMREKLVLQDNLSTSTNNVLDFSNIELSDDEFVTCFYINFGTVKIGFANTSKMKVETKVIEGLEDKSTFINNVKVSGTYLEKRTEDEDDVPVKVYENILKIRKLTKEYNQYTKKEAGERINATFDLLDENKEYITTFSVKDSEDFDFKYLETGKTYYLKEISTDPYYVINNDLVEFNFTTNGEIIELDIENENVNLVVDVEKDGPVEAEKGEIITYDFNNIGNFSNTRVNDFTWGDKLPRQVTAQSLETGTWNEELTYKIQYITNRNTNWKDIGEYSTTKNNVVDFTNIELAEGEYIKEYRLCFGNAKEGFKEVQAPKLLTKVNEDVQNNKIFVNDTYVTATYQETKLEALDDAHTVVYTKEKPKDKELPKTGLDD